jgi:hypothetical protein
MYEILSLFSDLTKLFPAFELKVFLLMKRNGICFADFSVIIIKLHQNALRRSVDETWTKKCNLVSMFLFYCAKNAHGMASEVIILTHVFMGGILLRDKLK